jgi:integrase
MMGTLTITTRKTSTGPRYHVRYRLGGRGWPVVHGGSFRTLKEAKARRDLIGGEIAAGRNPADTLLMVAAAPAPVKTVADWAAAYQRSRVDVTPATASTIASQLVVILRTFGSHDPEAITPAMVQEWVVGLALKPSTIGRYLATLRLVLDFAECSPNPARDKRVRLPRQERETITPPSAADVEAIIVNAPPRWRLLLVTLAETGMRINEVLTLVWQDVDQAASRFRIRSGKTAAARRWVSVPADLMREITAATPPDDQTSDRRVFQGTPAAVGNVITRACQSAGIAHYHPHDLRHRWISVQVKRGVPITEIAAAVGHSRTSVTLDTYSHVMLDD